jgi:hypothetical protein
MKLDYQVLRNTIYRAIKALRANIENKIVVNISGNGISGTKKGMNG